MAIEVRIPTILRNYTGGEKSVDASGATLVELIDDLEAKHPGIKDRLIETKSDGDGAGDGEVTEEEVVVTEEPARQTTNESE